jgi:ankyrin repeat protein
MFNGNPQLPQPSNPILLSPHTRRLGASSASGSSAHASQPTSNPTPATDFLFSGLMPSSLEHRNAGFVPAIQSRLQAISVELFEGEQLTSIQTLLGPPGKEFLSEFLKYSAYLASNNLLGPEKCDKILEGIVENSDHFTLGNLFATELQLPTMAAFARSLFESALRLRNAAVVQILLKAGVDPNSPTRINGMTPLQIAVSNDDMVLAKALLDLGADINALSTGRVRKSALHVALSNCYDGEEMVELLLRAGADPSVGGTIHCGRTVLQEAVETGDVELVKSLLRAGADVNAAAASSQRTDNSSAGTTALQFWALSEFPGDPELLERLLDAGADINAPPYWNPEAYDEEHPHDSYGVTALQAAASLGDIEIVQLLLEAGADVNAPPAAGPSGGKTALQEAAGRHQFSNNKTVLELIRMLLSAGADVNAPAANKRSTSRTALQAAAKIGNIERVQLLLESGAEINAPGCPVLSLALSSESCLQLVPLLLSAGADVNATGPGPSPLASAIRSKHRWEFVPMLLSAGADVNSPGCSPLVVAFQSRQQQLIPLLLNAGADVNAEHRNVSPQDSSFTGRTSPLIEAAKLGDVQYIELLLAQGAEVNATYGLTALQAAMFGNHHRAAEVLLRAGADPNTVSDYCFDTTLMAAVEKNDIDFVYTLLAHGVAVNQSFPDETGANPAWVSNALPLAVQIGNKDMVELLLACGANVDASAIVGEEEDEEELEDAFGTTALLMAVRSEQDELIALLLDAGANVNATPRPFGGWTALQAAARCGNTELVQTLLARGANVNAPAHTDRGRTALQAASFAGHIDLVRLLLKAGADVNAPAGESRGITALQGAAIQGHLGIALALIEAGADPNAPPAKFDGRTALEGAAEHGRLDMLQLLLNAKADIGGRYPERARDFALKNGHAVVAKVLEQFC